MTNTAAEAIPVEVPVTPLDDGGIAPYRGKRSSVDAVERVLIRLETADGTAGWGEIRATPSVETVVATLEADVFPAAVGREPHEITAFLEAFEYEYLDLDPVVAGVEMAMWDANARALEVPLHRLLGGATREAIPVAAPLGITDVPTARDSARRVRDAGYTVLKTKGGRDWQADVERVIAIDDAVGGELAVRLDPNQGYSTDEAVRVAARLEDAGVYLEYLEQPVRVDAVGTMARLRQRLRTPIAVNEDTYRRGNLFHLLREDAIDVAVVDIVPAGGIGPLRRQVGAAAEAGVSVAHHDAFDLGIKRAAVLHVAASTPAIDLAIDSVYPAYDRFLVEDPHAVEDGAIPVPDGPGLGVTVDRAALSEVRLDE